MIKLFAIIALVCGLTGCANNMNKVEIGAEPFIEGTPTEHLLRSIPPLVEQPVITIAVYDFPDMTGQRKQMNLALQKTFYKTIHMNYHKL